jgi:hypothetical protein
MYSFDQNLMVHWYHLINVQLQVVYTLYYNQYGSPKEKNTHCFQFAKQ